MVLEPVNRPLRGLNGYLGEQSELRCSAIAAIRPDRHRSFTNGFSCIRASASCPKLTFPSRFERQLTGKSRPTMPCLIWNIRPSKSQRSYGTYINLRSRPDPNPDMLSVRNTREDTDEFNLRPRPRTRTTRSEPAVWRLPVRRLLRATIPNPSVHDTRPSACDALGLKTRRVINGTQR